MSKLAHSDEQSMRLIDIDIQYRNRNSLVEFFDDAHENEVDPVDVGRALGRAIQDQYETHISYQHARS